MIVDASAIVCAIGGEGATGERQVPLSLTVLPLNVNVTEVPAMPPCPFVTVKSLMSTVTLIGPGQLMFSTRPAALSSIVAPWPSMVRLLAICRVPAARV